MGKLSDFTGGINPRPCFFFDKLVFVVEVALTDRQREQLNANARVVKVDPNEWPRDWETILEVVGATDKALRLLASLPGLTLRSVECAMDLIVANRQEAMKLHSIFDDHFVRSWHGKQRMNHVWETTYIGDTKQPGHSFRWYSDQGSKATGDPDCFHIEAVHLGLPALRQIGIATTRDLLKFDHVRFWRKVVHLRVVDLARLGRWHDNKVTGLRRQQGRRKAYGRVTYQFDRMEGGKLLRIYGQHEEEPYISTYQFVMNYGRGHFLSRIDVSALFDKATHMSDDTKNRTLSHESPTIAVP